MSQEVLPAAVSRRLLEYREAARFLGISVSHLQRLVQRREMPHHKIGRCVRFSEDDLRAFLEQSRVEPFPDDGPLGPLGGRRRG